jgi:ubiquinone/menaquinone biosynthesis C-methylase UbiE
VNIRESYDSAAESYAEHLFGELAHKPLDRHLLRRFAEEVRYRGDVVDLGCGPGHVTRFLNDLGASAIGVDLSPGMLTVAARRSPALRFQLGNMLKLDFANQSVAGAVSFYSIVHFAPEELPAVFAEMRRVVTGGGMVFLAFHIGVDIVHVGELFGARVSLDFRFHHVDVVSSALKSAGFTPFEISEREPYQKVEHQSRRCYLLARAS